MFHHYNEFVCIILVDAICCLRAETVRCGIDPAAAARKIGYVSCRMVSARKQRIHAGLNSRMRVWEWGVY
jgi:hypothetical protein